MCGSADKESTCNAGDLGSIPGLGRSLAEGKGYPLQYSGLENPMDCIVHGVTDNWTRLSDLHFHFQIIDKSWENKESSYHSNKCMIFRSDQIRSVTQSCPTLCGPMNLSTLGHPVHHQLLDFTETHVHQVSDAIQPSHPLSSPSPLAPNPSQHQSVFQWVNSSLEVAKVLEFQL